MDTKVIGENCGIAVSGVSLRSMEGEELEAVRDLIYRHGVAVFRDQDFSPEDHIAFAKRWGGIDINNYFPLTQEHPEIAVVRKNKDQQMNIGGGWHTDHSYDEVPAMGSILVARTLPPKGGDTLWAHMGAAYEALSGAMKEKLEGLEAFHTADHIYAPDGLYARTDQGSELRGQDLKTGATHPVVIRHPQTGQKLLYVNPGFTMHFAGMSREESRPLLQELFAHAMKQEHQCRIEWAPGTVAIWDNRTTWHYAMNDYQGYAREMHRITLSGEALAA
jgi:taurine dioxygenase